MQHTVQKRKPTKLPGNPSPNSTVAGPSGTLHWTVLAPVAFMLLVVLTVLVARVRFLSVPLERDEGEYAYIGQLMLQGVAPYAEAANMKLPGTDAAYAVLMAIFGQSVVGIHLGFLLVNAACIVLIFFLARRLFGVAAGVAAGASYAVLSVQPNVMGLWAHATHFVVLPALGGTLLLLKWTEQRKAYLLAASGLLFGTAFLAKQAGALFIVFGFLYLIYAERDDLRANVAAVLRNLALFGGCVILPFGAMCLLLWRAGVFARFWYWTFTYARQYVSTVPLSTGLNLFSYSAKPIVLDDLGVLLLAIAGLVALWRVKKNRTPALFLTAFLAFSFAAVCPGFYFREHYFILMLPAIALLAGAFATSAKRAWPLWIIAAAMAYPIWAQYHFLFELSPLEASRARYGANPFPEAIPIADYIRAHSNSDDRVAILGSEPEIYFYSHRKSVAPYLYLYPLFENQPLAAEMQDEFIRDVEAARPKFIVLVRVSSSWSIQPNSPGKLLQWVSPYCDPRYDLVGVVDMRDSGTVYAWDALAPSTMEHLKTPNFVMVLRRKGI